MIHVEYSMIVDWIVPNEIILYTVLYNTLLSIHTVTDHNLILSHHFILYYLMLPVYDSCTH